MDFVLKKVFYLMKGTHFGRLQKSNEKRCVRAHIQLIHLHVLLNLSILFGLGHITSPVQYFLFIKQYQVSAFPSSCIINCKFMSASLVFVLDFTLCLYFGRHLLHKLQIILIYTQRHIQRPGNASFSVLFGVYCAFT